jgi:hypothetical protein
MPKDIQQQGGVDASPEKSALDRQFEFCVKKAVLDVLELYLKKSVKKDFWVLLHHPRIDKRRYRRRLVRGWISEIKKVFLNKKVEGSERFSIVDFGWKDKEYGIMTIVRNQERLAEKPLMLVKQRASAVLEIIEKARGCNSQLGERHSVPDVGGLGAYLAVAEESMGKLRAVMFQRMQELRPGSVSVTNLLKGTITKGKGVLMKVVKAGPALEAQEKQIEDSAKRREELLGKVKLTRFVSGLGEPSALVAQKTRVLLEGEVTINPMQAFGSRSGVLLPIPVEEDMNPEERRVSVSALL